MAELTPKQSQFVKEYLIDLNATQAAIRAGYSQKNADKIGPKLLGKPQIEAAIQAAMKEREERTEVTQDKVVSQLAKIAFSDLKDFVKFGPDGIRVRDCEDVDGTLLNEVSGTKTKDGSTIKVKLSDRMKALELLGRHLGMFVDRQEITGKDGGPLEVRGDVTRLSDEELDAKLRADLEQWLAELSPGCGVEQLREWLANLEMRHGARKTLEQGE